MCSSFSPYFSLPSKKRESRCGESERCAVPRSDGGQAGEPLWEKRAEKHLTCRRRRRAGRWLGTILSSPCTQPAGAWLAAAPAPLGSCCRRGENPRGFAPRSAAAAGGLRGGGPVPSALPFARPPAPAFYNLPRSQCSGFPPSSSPGDGLHPPQPPAPPRSPSSSSSSPFPSSTSLVPSNTGLVCFFFFPLLSIFSSRNFPQAQGPPPAPRPSSPLSAPALPLCSRC